MRLVTLGAVATAGAALIAVPATAANASTPTASSRAASSSCATFSSFEKVTKGQTVQQVEQEMGSAGDPNGGVSDQAGFRIYEPIWHSCSLLGLGQFQMVFRAEPGQPLILEGKAFI